VMYKSYGRHSGTRCWQDQVDEVLTSKDCPLKMERCPKVPTVYFCVSDSVTVNIHADYGNGCGPPDGKAIGKLVDYLSSVLDLTYSGLIGADTQYGSDSDLATDRATRKSVSARAMTQGLLLISALGSSKAAEVVQTVAAEPVVEYPASLVPVPSISNQILLVFSVEQIVIAVSIFVSMFWLLVYRVLRRYAPASNVLKLSHKVSSVEVLWQIKTGRKLHRSRECSSLKHSDQCSVFEAEICRLCRDV
jgi:hypothetical protein